MKQQYNNGQKRASFTDIYINGLHAGMAKRAGDGVKKISNTAKGLKSPPFPGALGGGIAGGGLAGDASRFRNIDRGKAEKNLGTGKAVKTPSRRRPVGTGGIAGAAVSGYGTKALSEIMKERFGLR